MTWWPQPTAVPQMAAAPSQSLDGHKCAGLQAQDSAPASAALNTLYILTMHMQEKDGVMNNAVE